MQRNYNYKRFTFSNNKATLIAALDTILVHIRQGIGNLRNADNIISRSKWILTELLTNASKHSNENLINFDICIGNSIVEIAKLEYGEPFAIQIDDERKTFPGSFIENNQYIIHKDDLCILYATVSNKIMTFTIEDVEITGERVHEINEHFGLIIITKSSDKFTYKYDFETKANIFMVKLNLA